MRASGAARAGRSTCARARRSTRRRSRRWSARRRRSTRRAPPSGARAGANRSLSLSCAWSLATRSEAMAGSRVLKLVRDALRGDRRRAARYRVALEDGALEDGALEDGAVEAGAVETGGTVSVTIHDLSLTGALIEAERLPAVGAEVTLTHGLLAERAVLAWKHGRQAGLRFERPL